MKTGDSIDRIQVGLGMNKIIGEVILEAIQGILTEKIAEEIIEVITKMKFMTEAEMGNRSRERSFSRNFSDDRNRSTSSSRSRSGLRASTN